MLLALALVGAPGLGAPAQGADPGFCLQITNAFGRADVGNFSSPAFADIDGDGDLDAFIGEELGNTIFFQNTGTVMAPAFAAPATNPFGLSERAVLGNRCGSA